VIREWSVLFAVEEQTVNVHFSLFLIMVCYTVRFDSENLTYLFYDVKFILSELLLITTCLAQVCVTASNPEWSFSSVDFLWSTVGLLICYACVSFSKHSEM